MMNKFWELMKKSSYMVIIFSAVIAIVLYVSDIKVALSETEQRLNHRMDNIERRIDKIESRIDNIEFNDIAHLQLEQEYQGKVLRLIADYIMTGDKKAFAVGLREVDEWREHARYELQRRQKNAAADNSAPSSSPDPAK